jgi:hypothetical protein
MHQVGRFHYLSNMKHPGPSRLMSRDLIISVGRQAVRLLDSSLRKKRVEPRESYAVSGGIRWNFMVILL